MERNKAGCINKDAFCVTGKDSGDGTNWGLNAFIIGSSLRGLPREIIRSMIGRQVLLLATLQSSRHRVVDPTCTDTPSHLHQPLDRLAVDLLRGTA